MLSLSEICVGLIVNPIAGMGGSVGLKGSDGELVQRARVLGAVPGAVDRAGRALESLSGLRELRIVTAAGDMGEAAAHKAGMKAEIIGEAANSVSTAADTRRLAVEMQRAGVDLLLFAGGDGTARDILAAVGDGIATVGIPAGVKMHSAVFAMSPRAAGELARLYLASTSASSMLEPAEVMDRPPGKKALSPELYGYLRMPRAPSMVVAAKAVAAGGVVGLAGACARVATLLQDDRVSLLGPGSTLARIKERIGCASDLLAIDAWFAGRCIVADGTEEQLWQAIKERPARIVVTVIGGQGFLFGRGNQQLSPRIIQHVGRENIVVVAAAEKLSALADGAVVDTGDESVDRMLAGFLPVITGSRQTMMLAVRSATDF